MIGVANDRTVSGIDDPDAVLLCIDDVAFQRCRPPLIVVPEVVPLEGKSVVVLNIPKGDQRPYATQRGLYYVRSGARCRAASREELLRLFQASTALYYDEQPLPRLDLTDLDLDAVTRQLAVAGVEDVDDPSRVLRDWRLYDGAHPTVGGHRPLRPYSSGRARVEQGGDGCTGGERHRGSLLREQGGGELGIAVSDAEVVLTLPRGR